MKTKTPTDPALIYKADLDGARDLLLRANRKKTEGDPLYGYEVQLAAEILPLVMAYLPAHRAGLAYVHEVYRELKSAGIDPRFELAGAA